MTFNLSTCDHEIAGSAQVISKFLIEKDFGNHRLTQKSSKEPFAALKFKSFGPLSISEHGFGSEVVIDTPMMTDIYHLQIMLGGRSTVHYNGKQQRLSVGDALIITPNSGFASEYSEDCRKLLIKIPVDFLQQTAREFGYLSCVDPIRFDFEKCVFPTSGPVFNLLNDILEQGSDVLSERALLYYTKLLGNAILSTFNSNVSTSSSLYSHQHRHIDRIRDHVLNHITDDIAIEELASLCQISRKSLYNLFERETGITPSAYVRRLKLESVHSELSSNLDIRNVTEVALKYGFTNLGRFSAQYREHIGELPSETLRSIA